jgi:hypothetical protein
MNRTIRATAGQQVILAVALAFVASTLRAVAGGQAPPADLLSTRSFSGQFIAFAGRSAASPPALLSLATSQNFVQLEPTLVTVSCERIKQLLLRELGSTAPWRGTIYVVLYPARAASDTVTITSERFKSGWQYRVDLPDLVDRSRYVRAIVQVLLLEVANRTAQARPAEIPVWLIEGFGQLLLASSEVEIILPPPQATPSGLNVSRTQVATRKESLRQQAQKKLRGRPPLTFEGLSWPTEQELSGEAGEVYRGSAQLFVGELLRLPDGRACLQTMLAQLPQHYNWQFAFLGAFRAHFERPLDIEKWWSLALTQASGRDAAQTWPLEASWQKLDQAIRSGVQVRTGTHDLPLHAAASLQQVIREWDAGRQTEALNHTLRELGLLRLRIAQECVGLVQDYSQTIETYLKQRDRGAAGFLSSKRAAQRRAAAAAIQQLDALDARREAMRPAPRPASAGSSLALPGPGP